MQNILSTAKTKVIRTSVNYFVDKREHKISFRLPSSERNQPFGFWSVPPAARMVVVIVVVVVVVIFLFAGVSRHCLPV